MSRSGDFGLGARDFRERDLGAWDARERETGDWRPVAGISSQTLHLFWRQF